MEVPATNKEPVLTKADPQGINPNILILVLTIRDTGDVGSDVLTWREARYEETDVSEGQYSQVDIMWEQDIIASIDNIEIVQ